MGYLPREKFENITEETVFGPPFKNRDENTKLAAVWPSAMSRWAFDFLQFENWLRTRGNLFLKVWKILRI